MRGGEEQVAEDAVQARRGGEELPLPARPAPREAVHPTSTKGEDTLDNSAMAVTNLPGSWPAATSPIGFFRATASRGQGMCFPAKRSVCAV